MEFKVEDKLRYIENRPEWYTEGAVYEVTGIDEGEDGIWIVINDNEGLYRGWQPVDVPKFFERMDEPQADQSESQPQVTKVKLTQEQAQALEIELTSFHNNVAEFLEIHAQIVNCEENHYTSEVGALNELSVADLARALLIGYEVEQTAEEKVFKRWEKSVTSFNTAVFKEGLGVTTAFEHGYQNGMKSVLKAYGITVKGINDND